MDGIILGPTLNKDLHYKKPHLGHKVFGDRHRPTSMAWHDWSPYLLPLYTGSLNLELSLYRLGWWALTVVFTF